MDNKKGTKKTKSKEKKDLEIWNDDDTFSKRDIYVSKYAKIAPEDIEFWRGVLAVIKEAMDGHRVGITIHTPEFASISVDRATLFMLTKSPDPDEPIALSVRASAPHEIIVYCVAKIAKKMDFEVGEVFDVNDDNVVILGDEAVEYFIKNITKLREKLSNKNKDGILH